MTAEPTPPVVIIGIGNVMRRDDGIGPAALVCLEQTDLAHLGGMHELLTLDGEPARLLEAWRGRRLAIIIDAARSSNAPGSIHRIKVGTDPLPAWAAGRSTHSAGIAEAVALGRALEVLPEQLILFGIDVADFSPGEGLSSVVSAALPALVDQVVAEATR